MEWINTAGWGGQHLMGQLRTSHQELVNAAERQAGLPPGSADRLPECAELPERAAAAVRPADLPAVR